MTRRRTPLTASRQRATRPTAPDWSQFFTGGSLPRLRVVAPAIAVALVMALDQTASSLATQAIPVEAALDEPAHLLTAVLVLAALPPGATRGRWPAALVACVAIDLDHIPLYLFGEVFSADGRPPTHSLMTVLVAAAAGAIFAGLRRPLLGVALGFGLHLVRDLATGPGVALLWPIWGEAVLVPYRWYQGTLVVLAALATVTLARSGRRHRLRSRFADQRGRSGTRERSTTTRVLGATTDVGADRRDDDDTRPPLAPDRAQQPTTTPGNASAGGRPGPPLGPAAPPAADHLGVPGPVGLPGQCGAPDRRV
ncbi:MAG TPA: metal-dependent hydrolase [Microlunatus sp.]